MQSIPNDAPILHAGLYEHLLSTDLERATRQLPKDLAVAIGEVDAADANATVSQYVGRFLLEALNNLSTADANTARIRIVDRILKLLDEELSTDHFASKSLVPPLQRLLAVQPHDASLSRPTTPLSQSALLTGTRADPSLASQLANEIATADCVDILCSFIRWSGLQLLLGALQTLTSDDNSSRPKVRVISTSYMGATDPRAIEMLRMLPNTEVKMSYDTTRTRLHAKSYIIHRKSGFGSAYISSANISKPALSDGLEWTSKISQYELPHLWDKAMATFETYWNDDEFEHYGEGSLERLQRAITRERNSTPIGIGELPSFDLRPFPFQEQILDDLAAEREIQGKQNHLVVAATGTGKTVIAAFDYKQWAGDRRPPLLFIAHRQEILIQALGTFRAVLRDQNFGDILSGGDTPTQSKHLFCSIQTFNSRRMWESPPDEYHYVVVDEFHHAAAASYRRLLDHVTPKVLLGLTATPERSDALDVLHWFDGEASAEIRLPDAINRRLLCPFQYFGVADSVDLSSLKWQRGGYRVDDLDQVYTGNDVRASLILCKMQEYVLDPKASRTLGFCVSVAHAEFMARFFNEHGIPAMALSGGSSRDERRSAKERLVRREINVIFVVDLYNEGVDIPEVDTVLLLRPSESLTVYLQQLGRGLRLHDDKDCLTVLDFIGAHRREFRMALRFRALSTDPAGNLERELESGCPHLPAGCFVQLERIAKERVLNNIRHSTHLRRPQMIQDLRGLSRHLGRAPTIREATEYLDTTLDELLKRGLWSRLLADAGHVVEITCPDEDQLAKGCRRLCHIDDPQQIRFAIDYLHNQQATSPSHITDALRSSLLHMSLWSSAGSSMTLDEAENKLSSNSTAITDLITILEYRLSRTHTRFIESIRDLTGPLALHATYTRDECLTALGHWKMNQRPRFTEGVLHLPDKRIDAFFNTLHKTEGDYSPTTMYEDYAINDRLFHWQSQSRTSDTSTTGQRYINHQRMGYTPLLFVRERRNLPSGLTAPYSFLGPARYVSHSGNRPMSIIWELETPMPARLWTKTSQAATG